MNEVRVTLKTHVTGQASTLFFHFCLVYVLLPDETYRYAYRVFVESESSSGL